MPNNQNRPKVSIIMNCYNGEKYLSEAINSVYNQSFQNWEIILWDNNSNDDTASIAQSYDKKLKYFKSDINTSLGAARNMAIERASGEFISFLDCDDIWIEDKLKRQINFMEVNQFLASYAGIFEIDESGNKIRSVIPVFTSGDMFSNILTQFEINVPTMTLHSDIFNKFGYKFNNNIKIVEEFELFIRISLEFPIGVIKDELAKYRVHSNSITSQTSLEASIERNNILEDLKRTNVDSYLQNKKYFQLAFARSAYYVSRSYAFNGDMKKARDSIKEYISINFFYRIIYLSYFLPGFIWNTIKFDELKRNKAVSKLAMFFLMKK